METAGSNSLMPIIVAIIGSQGLIVAALALAAYRIGRLPSREESNDLRKEVSDTKVELKQDIADTKLEILTAKTELRQEIVDSEAKLRQEIVNTKRELETKIDATKDEVLRAIHSSHQQLMLALVNHTHNANGQATFTLPPETEPVPAPADD